MSFVGKKNYEKIATILLQPYKFVQHIAVDVSFGNDLEMCETNLKIKMEKNALVLRYITNWNWCFLAYLNEWMDLDIPATTLWQKWLETHESAFFIYPKLSLHFKRKLSHHENGPVLSMQDLFYGILTTYAIHYF